MFIVHMMDKLVEKSINPVDKKTWVQILAL